MRNSQGIVYLIWAIDTSLYKIGFSNNPDKRFESIQTACPFPLKLVGGCKGTMEDEKRLHLQLQEWRYKGEWFNLPPQNVWMLLSIMTFPPDDSGKSIEEWVTFCRLQATRIELENRKAARMAHSDTQQPRLFA